MTAYSSFRKNPPAFCQMFVIVCTAVFLSGMLALSFANGGLDGDELFISIIATGLFLIFIESTVRGLFPHCR